MGIMSLVARIVICYSKSLRVGDSVGFHVFYNVVWTATKPSQSLRG